MDEPIVGFSVEVELSNDADLVSAGNGRILPSQFRRERCKAVVAPHITRLVIPESLAKRLGLIVEGSTRVRYRDGRTADRGIARRVGLRCAGRNGIYSAVVEPERDSAIIGLIVLQDLDLIIDCSNQQLVPRDPDRIIAEIE